MMGRPPPRVCMDGKHFVVFRKGFRFKKDDILYEDYRHICNGEAYIILFIESWMDWRYANEQKRKPLRGL